MKVPLTYVASSLLPSAKDVAFNSWCTEEAGILRPNAEVRTTPRSVAGRGVFTTRDASEGDVLLSIPNYAVLTQGNGRRYFPDVARKLDGCRERNQSPMRRVWNRIRSKREVFDDEQFWQAELTAYAVESLETGHPWAIWVSQWIRDDPYQQLVDAPDRRLDERAVNDTLAAFGEMAPDISKYKVNAAMDLRLAELNEYKRNYRHKAPFSESIYTTLVSRAIDIGEGVTALLPMHDMINHSSDPNVSMRFNEEGCCEFTAERDIPKDSELFLSYMDVTDEKGTWDEDRATWMLVQWGIPTSPANN